MLDNIEFIVVGLYIFRRHEIIPNFTVFCQCSLGHWNTSCMYTQWTTCAYFTGCIWKLLPSTQRTPRSHFWTPSQAKFHALCTIQACSDWVLRSQFLVQPQFITAFHISVYPSHSFCSGESKSGFNCLYAIPHLLIGLANLSFGPIDN